MATAKAKAVPKAKSKAQGFSKASSNFSKPASKRITSNTLYKNWVDTMHTAKLNRNAKKVELPFFQTKELRKCIDQVSNFSPTQLQRLHYLGSFKKNQFNELFEQPSLLFRNDSIGKLIKILNEKQPNTNKHVIITGEPGVGKSSLLAQLHAYAIDSNYIVLNISYPDLFLNGRCDFYWDDKLKKYVQPMYLKKLLTKILKGNDNKLLSSLKLQNDYKFTFTNISVSRDIILKKNENTISDLLSCKINANQRGDQFNALINELSMQKETPVLFTIDNISKLLTSSSSAYRDTSNNFIPTLKFQIPNTIMEITSGKISFMNKQSSFVGAVSGLDRKNETLPVGLNKMKENLYSKIYDYDPTFAKLLREGNVEEFQLSKLNKVEVKSLIDFYSQCGFISPIEKERSGSLEQLAEEKYFLSGNGNPRELLRSLTLAYR